MSVGPRGAAMHSPPMVRPSTANVAGKSRSNVVGWRAGAAMAANESSRCCQYCLLCVSSSLCLPFLSFSVFLVLSVDLIVARAVSSVCRPVSKPVVISSTCVQTRSHQQQPPVSHAPHALARTHARTHLHAHTPGPHWRAVASAHHTLSLLRKRSGTLGSLSTAMISLRTVDLSGLAVPAIISSKVDARPSPATTHLGRARASRRQQQPVTARRGGGG